MNHLFVDFEVSAGKQNLRYFFRLLQNDRFCLGKRNIIQLELLKKARILWEDKLTVICYH